MAGSTRRSAPLRWPDPALIDAVIRLDAMRDEDAPAIAEGAGDEEVARWIPVPVPYTLEDARQYLDQQRQEAEDGHALTLGIRRAGAPGLVGSVAARFAGRPGEAELGYWVSAPARGEGLARRAVRLLAGHVLTALDVHRVELLVHPANIPSQRVCVAAGCTAEGLRRAASPAVREDGWEPMLVYSLLLGDLDLAA